MRPTTTTLRGVASGPLGSLLGLTLRAVPIELLIWLERRRAPLGRRVAERAWCEGLRRWRDGRRAHDHFIPF